MKRLAAAALLAIVLAIPAAGGKYNRKLNIGDPAPTFRDLPGTDDKSHSLSDFKRDVVVICIICNHCDESGKYEDRIIALAKKYAGQVDFVAINVSTLAEDQPDLMKERAKEKGYNFPYLYDGSEKVGKALGAAVTPEFFVLGKDRKIVYMGLLDDSADPKKVEHRYLDDAIAAALNGEKPAKAETHARGCAIPYQTK